MNASNTPGEAPSMEGASMRRALTLTEMGVIISMLASAATAVFTLGVVYGDVKDHERRISTIEPKVDSIEKRLERIDTNVGLLVEQAREDRNRR